MNIKTATVEELQKHVEDGWTAVRGTVIWEKPYLWVRKGDTHRLVPWPQEVAL
jgi:hypothetical protein